MSVSRVSIVAPRLSACRCVPRSPTGGRGRAGRSTRRRRGCRLAPRVPPGRRSRRRCREISRGRAVASRRRGRWPELALALAAQAVEAAADREAARGDGHRGDRVVGRGFHVSHWPVITPTDARLACDAPTLSKIPPPTTRRSPTTARHLAAEIGDEHVVVDDGVTYRVLASLLPDEQSARSVLALPRGTVLGRAGQRLATASRAGKFVEKRNFTAPPALPFTAALSCTTGRSCAGVGGTAVRVGRGGGQGHSAAPGHTPTVRRSRWSPAGSPRRWRPEAFLPELAVWTVQNTAKRPMRTASTTNTQCEYPLLRRYKVPASVTPIAPAMMTYAGPATRRWSRSR